MSLSRAGKVVVAVTGVSFALALSAGLGWHEPALAAGPRFDPPLLPGLDIAAAQNVRECVAPLFMPRFCGWWM
ncbi:hypothetical protein [Mameliella sediminis]|uniref:hypothetical protein n=1 Tax=Mameliella sediminis TaxID=2836866 RepID=UPI001C49268C|nr:hypothetical protein [Mameliella sediminis]MBV7393660.1 hypothetical protein [Mameliella sediminis]